MHPAGPPPPSQPPTPQNRSCPSPSLAQCPSPSPSLIQQQQHIIYGPITTLQPCPANIHPHCVYTGIQRNPGLTGNSGPMSNQVPIRHTKVAKWQPKSKPTRGGHQHHHHHHQQQQQQQSHQQYCHPFQHQQAHVQQPLSYIPKPLVLYDQCQTNQPPPGVHPPAASFLVASSTFSHAPYGPSDHYTSAAGLTLIPPPYFKPPEVTQAFCLIPERSPSTQQHHHHHQQQSLTSQPQSSYYNVTNTCNLRAINAKPAFHLTNISNPYGNVTTFGNNQMATGQVVPTGQIFQNSTMTYGPPCRDKFSMLPGIDVQAMTCSRNLTNNGDTKQQESMITRTENIDWPVQITRENSNNNFETPDTVNSPRISTSPVRTNRLDSLTTAKNKDERFSDESAASFDFTIEAEKMVSALCNTVSSNELGKDETRVRNETLPSSFGGAAGDNVTNKTDMWFADFCTEYGVSIGQNNHAASTQTQEDRHDPQRYPEIMRKTIYWGCNEAENILNSSCYRGNSRAKWLGNISSATRTAVTKSSTCFPIFSGDKTFVQDLINAVLRISNGWLVLDNYLNKQHYPSLDEKFDKELKSRFQTWEVVTQDLLRELVKTLVNVEESNNNNCSTSLEILGFQENPTCSSFPGDVNLYTNNDLFDSVQILHQEGFSKFNNCPRNERDSTYTLQYQPQSTSNPNFHNFESRQQTQKETKLRSKWTITENLSSTIDSAKSVPDITMAQNDLGFTGGNRFRVKNSSNTSTTKFTTSSRHSLNAEFFHLQNKVMESMGNSSELERQPWTGLKEQQYDYVFGTSRATNTSGQIVPVSCEPIFKIRGAGSSYENAYTRRCLSRMDTKNSVNQIATTSHCTNVDEKIYLAEGTKTAIDSTYIAGVSSTERNKTYTEPDYTGNVRIAELNEHNCGSGVVVSATSISSIKTEPVYVGNTSFDQRELTTIPRTKMTLLSQIEGNTTNTSKDTKEMTANLSAWFASMRKPNSNRMIGCPVDVRKNENTTTIVRTSTHPQETSRSAMDLSRQLHMDGNRQLQTLQNMQAIQSQPWNAANLLNNKRTTSNVHRGPDEYDSSEDVRVYMKPGSYNVPKKRHHRKNNRKSDNTGNSRGNNNNTPRSHTSRGGHGGNYNSVAKNHQVSTSVSSVLMASSVEVSTTTTTTSTSIRLPFPATPNVPSTSTFSLENSPSIARRVRSFSKQETRQDVAWKAACASAEILLEALNVKASSEDCNTDSKSPNSLKNVQMDYATRNQDEGSIDNSSVKQESTKDPEEDVFCEVSSYEASEDDSSSTCKFSPERFIEAKCRDTKQPKTNVKTDSWLIRTLNNASIVSTINRRESDAESTIGGSMNSSIHEEHRDYKTVVTSTPEPVKISSRVISDDTTIVGRKLDHSFPDKSMIDSPRDSENLEQLGSSNRQIPSRNLSISLIDTSGEFVGRATYSETVRRSTGKSCIAGKMDCCRSRQTRSMSSIEPTTRSSIIPTVERKCQRRDNERNYQSIHRSRKTNAKRLSKDLEEKDREEGRTNKKIVNDDDLGDNSTRPLAVNKCQTKRKDDGGSCGGWTETKTKVSERGWSVWYSSRRKQALSTLALNKLSTIHQTVWQMDDAKLLKYPITSLSESGGSTEMIEDDCKVMKSPIFLETIGYKLKNRIYHKIEHVMRDFRRIVNNSKLYHKNDTDRISKIETLAKRLEELFEEHFSNCEFDNVTESPRSNNVLSNAQASRCKSPQRRQQKTGSSRLSNLAKKNSATSVKNEI